MENFKEMSEDDYNKLVDEFEAALDTADKQGITAKSSASDVIPIVCRGYAMIRPILRSVLLIPFVPRRIKNAIRKFIEFMDGICS